MISPARNYDTPTCDTRSDYDTNEAGLDPNTLIMGKIFNSIKAGNDPDTIKYCGRFWYYFILGRCDTSHVGDDPCGA